MEVQLDKKVLLELMESESVFFAHKVSYWESLWTGGNYSFAITNQRIALVHYRNGKEAENISYAKDLTAVRAHFSISSFTKKQNCLVSFPCTY